MRTLKATVVRTRKSEKTMRILAPFRVAVVLICCLAVPAYAQGPGAGDPSIVWDQVVARAWTEPDFKAKLLRDPNAALAEHGFKVRGGKNVRVVENTTDTEHLVLPEPCSTRCRGR